MAESVSSLNISPIMRNCTPLVFQVNLRPAATNAPISTYPHRASFICVISSFIIIENDEGVPKIIATAIPQFWHTLTKELIS